MMHASIHGVLMFVIKVILSSLNPSEKFDLDVLVDAVVVPMIFSLKKLIQNAALTQVLLI